VSKVFVRVDSQLVNQVKQRYPEYADLTPSDIVRIALRKMILTEGER